MIYSLENKEYELKITVVDTKVPSFTVHNQIIRVGQSIRAQDLVEHIKDDTEVQVYFKKKYDFSRVGQYNVIVVVEDEAGNKAEKNAIVEVKV